MSVKFDVKSLLEKLNVGQTGSTDKTQNGKETRQAAETQKVKSTDIYTLAKEYGLNEEDMKKLEQSANYGMFDSFSSSSTDSTEETEDVKKEKELHIL